MDPNTCPRCGNPVTVKPRGRPALWCSDRCRKLASEERRAGERGAIGLQIRHHTRVVEKPVPERMSATVAAARAAEDIEAALSVPHRLHRSPLPGPFTLTLPARLAPGTNRLRAACHRPPPPPTCS